MGASVPDTKFIGIPFGTSGDRATIPEATQPSGALSWQQGFGPDYERDPATDPLAKRVPRDETNEFYFQVSNILRYFQLYGLPEWFAVDGSGNPVSYPAAARVRHNNAAWVSLVASNAAQPGTDPMKWSLDTAFSVEGVESSLNQMLAGENASTLATPRRVASSVQRGAWNYAVAGGSGNALTAAVTPAPTLSEGMLVCIRVPTNNTGATTLNLNGLGAVPVLNSRGNPLSPADLIAGGFYQFVYSAVSSAFRSTVPLSSDLALRVVSRFEMHSPFQNVPNNVVTDVGPFQQSANFGLLDSVVNPTTGTFTVGARDAGVWQLSSAVLFSSTSGIGFLSTGLKVNGVVIAGGQIGNTSWASIPVATRTVALVAGDVVRSFCSQQFGVSLGIQNVVNSQFSGARLGS